MNDRGEVFMKLIDMICRVLFILCFGYGYYSITNDQIAGGISLCFVSLIFPLIGVASSDIKRKRRNEN